MRLKPPKKKERRTLSPSTVCARCGHANKMHARTGKRACQSRTHLEGLDNGKGFCLCPSFLDDRITGGKRANCNGIARHDPTPMEGMQS